MFLALAVLLIQPATLPQPSVVAATPSIAQPADAIAADATIPDASANATDASASPVAAVAGAEAAGPAAGPSATDALPTAPTPVSPEPIVATPVEQSNPMKNGTVSVSQLLAEGRHNEHMWLALSVAEHSAASFDAWTTRHSITVDGAHELNPILKPFAGNDSIYAAIQAGPLLMDYLGKKMMDSRHSWVRRMWWVPQTASIASSLVCGGHNLTVQPAGN